MKLRTRLTAALAALVLLSIAATTAVGYTGQVEGSITVSGTPTCEPFTMTATVLDAAGAPVVGQSVAWAFVTSPSASDVISPTPTITDSKGKATTTVTFAPVSGTREIRATAGSVSASAVLSPLSRSVRLGRVGARHARTGRPSEHVDAPGRILRGHPDRGAVPRRHLRARRRPGAAPPGRGDTQLRSGRAGARPRHGEPARPVASMTDLETRPDRGRTRRAAMAAVAITIIALGAGLAFAACGRDSRPTAPPDTGEVSPGVTELPLVSITPAPTAPASSPATATAPGASLAASPSPEWRAGDPHPHRPARDRPRDHRG